MTESQKMADTSSHLAHSACHLYKIIMHLFIEVTEYTRR